MALLVAVDQSDTSPTVASGMPTHPTSTGVCQPSVMSLGSHWSTIRLRVAGVSE